MTDVGIRRSDGPGVDRDLVISVASVPRIALVGWLDNDLLVRSDRAGTPELWTVDASTGSFRSRLTPGEFVGHARAAGGVVLYERDHDGDEIHQLFRVDREGVRSPVAAEPGVIHDLGPISPDAERLAYASDAADPSRFDVRLRSMDGRQDELVWAPGGYAFPAAWSPDGSRLAAGRIGSRSLETELVVIDLGRRDVLRVTPQDPGGALWGYADGRPAVAWRPDGSSFLFLTNAGREHLGIAEWNVADREWRYVLTEEHDLAFALEPTGDALAVVVNRDGRSELSICDARTCERRHAIELPHSGVVSDLSFSADGSTLAFVFEAPAIAPEVWTIETAGQYPRPLTHDAPAELQAHLASPSEVWIRSFDAERIQTFVHQPPRPSRRPPTVIVIHGGPEMQAKYDFEPYVQALAAAGFLVLRPNIRGSTGFGRTFASLDDGRQRLDALRDLVAIREWAVTAGGADPESVCLWGVSYGGLLSNLALVHEPGLWAAAVVAVAVSSLTTFLETIAPWRRPVREAEYGRLDENREFFERIAALNHADQVVAPILLVHAANDLRVPVRESRQLHAALAAIGREPPLIVFEDDGHHFDRVANRASFALAGTEFLAQAVRDR